MKARNIFGWDHAVLSDIRQNICRFYRRMSTNKTVRPTHYPNYE